MQVAELQTTISTHESKLSDVSSEKAQLSSNVDRLTAREAELTSLVNEHQSKISSLEADKARATERLKEIENSHGDLSKQVIARI